MLTFRTLTRAITVLGLLVGTARAGATKAVRFEPVGLGGGGGMFAPASSPHDPNLMFVSCDMGGFYRSTDGGRSWMMLDFRITRGSTRCRPVFHPKNPNIIYFAGKMSFDRGRTWRRISPGVNFGRIVEMAVDPDAAGLLLIGTEDGAWLSLDNGRRWRKCPGISGRVVGMYIDPTSPAGRRRLFIATERAIWRSDDGGETFTKKCTGLPWRDIRCFRGASDGKRVVLYCTIPSKPRRGKFAGGVYRSVDLGEHWRPAMGKGINKRLGRVDTYGAGSIAQYLLLGVAEGHPDTVYVTCRGTGYWPPYHSTVYRSDDGGKTWRYIFNPDFRYKEFNVEQGWLAYSLSWRWGGLHTATGFSVNPANPDVAMICNAGELFVTFDGGKHWRQAYTRYAPGQPKPVPVPGKRPGRWQSIGLEVTTTWNYYIDPFDHNRHYICYTDIGFAISEDHGRTWRNNSRSSGTPWTNTTYMLAFDPDRPGVVYAAMSKVHDIPHWTYIHDKVAGHGGVCVSTDHCETWRICSDGLPAAPCTSIVLDPTSPVDSRTLYVTMFGYGVYKSTDGGKTWARKSRGLWPRKNIHTFLIKRHPDGTLFVCVTATRKGRKFPVLGGLYRSRDGAEHWENITENLPLHWPVGFDFDPRDSNVIYLAAGTIPGSREGGLYRTTDGGRTWQRLLRDEDFAGKGGPNWVHAMFVTVDPLHPDVIYLGTGAHGLWYTSDGGRTWKQFEGIPFASIHRVTFDPDDHGLIYVTTFGGGVWRGRAPAP